MSEEAEIFHGNRAPDRTEGVKKSKQKANTIAAEVDLDTSGESAQALAEIDADHPPSEIASAETAEENEAAQYEYHFDIDPESLWTMPPAMQERMSNLASAAAMTNERLDDQEKAIAKINKALRQLI